MKREELLVDEGSGHEHRGISIRLVAFITLGLAVGLAVSAIITLGLFNYFKYVSTNDSRLNPMATPATLPPEPRLQVHPQEELGIMRAHEDQVLNGYGWVNQSAGAIHIPIEQAKDLLIQHGLPVRAQQKGSAPGQAGQEGQTGSNAPAEPARQKVANPRF